MKSLTETGKKIAEQFLTVAPECYAPKGYEGAAPGGNGQFVMYAVSSLWLNALQFSRKAGLKDLEDRLIRHFEPYYEEKSDKCSCRNHVDFSVFGAVPLEIAVLTADARALEKGLWYADHQWEAPDPLDLGDNGNADYETQMEYLRRGFSPQSRLWIEDMYMITVLQVQAYLATGDMKYVERTAAQMDWYLAKMQLPNGLFHHSATAPFHWGRGNGWVAGGMPLMLENLPVDNPHFGNILAAYRRMMATLLEYQHPSGLWGQLVDDPDAWDESSCSGMFTSSMVKGIRHGWLDEKVYGPAVGKAWDALCGRIDAYGNVGGTGAGINCQSERRGYLECPTVNGAPHGQAAMLWTINAML